MSTECRTCDLCDDPKTRHHWEEDFSEDDDGELIISEATGEPIPVWACRHCSMEVVSDRACPKCGMPTVDPDGWCLECERRRMEPLELSQEVAP